MGNPIQFFLIAWCLGICFLEENQNLIKKSSTSKNAYFIDRLYLALILEARLVKKRLYENGMGGIIKLGLDEKEPV